MCVWASILGAVVALLLPFTNATRANGESSLALHRFSYLVFADEQLNFIYRWRVTVCTPGPGRVRIRAIVESFDFGTDSNRFVRHQRAGCMRHRLRAYAEIPEGSTDSMLRVAWKGQHRHTHWLSESDPAPD